LCCGTGLSTAALYRCYPKAKITGLDASYGMLDIARGKQELKSVTWLEGDAMDPAAHGASGPYHGILMAYGIRNMVDPDACLRRLYQLLEPGGFQHRFGLLAHQRLEQLLRELLLVPPHGEHQVGRDVALWRELGRQQVVVVGAHYDSVRGTPGADDNGSGVAATIEIARLVKARVGGAWPASAPAVKFVLFANEEMPFFGSPHMGSLVYAMKLKELGLRVAAMYSLETLGYYQDTPGSQRYPWPFSLAYPDRGDFLAFVGDLRSRRLVRNSIAAFREVASFPSEGIAAPRAVPGVQWSDHWAFWEQGWPAIMITDTAPYRNPNYHTARDTPDTLDYDRLTRVVHGLSEMVRVSFGEPRA